MSSFSLKHCNVQTPNSTICVKGEPFLLFKIAFLLTLLKGKDRLVGWSSECCLFPVSTAPSDSPSLCPSLATFWARTWTGQLQQTFEIQQRNTGAQIIDGRISSSAVHVYSEGSPAKFRGRFPNRINCSRDEEPLVARCFWTSILEGLDRIVKDKGLREL